MTIFYKIRNFLSNKWWNFRKRCQRFQRGYAWSDVWNMDTWFLDTMTSMLQHLLDTHHGHPSAITNSEWEDILREMIVCLRLSDEDEARALLEITEDVSSPELHIKAMKLTEEKKNRFFELFSKWFFDLWD